MPPQSHPDPQGGGCFIENKRESVASFLRFSAGHGLPRWPLEIFLEISNVCDLRCAMCPTFSALNPHRFDNLRQHERGVLDIDSAAPLADLLERALVVHAFGYGEPTVNPHFREFIRFLARYQVMVDFFTHGMHLTEDLCEFLVAEKVFKITISFSGATAPDYENVYLGGKFNQVLTGLGHLAAAKRRAASRFPIVEVNSIGFRHHIEKLPQFVELMAQSGVDVIHLKPLQTYDAIEQLHSHTSFFRPEIEGRILATAKKVARRQGIILASAPYENGCRAPVNHPGHGAPEVPLESLAQLAKETQVAARARQGQPPRQRSAPPPLEPDTTRFFQTDGIPCFEPFKTFYAAYDGRVFPCCFKSTQRPLGNLKLEGSATGVWNNAMYRLLRKRAAAGELAQEMCGDCVRAGLYPRRHGVGPMVARYADWLREGHGLRFGSRLVRLALGLPENRTILERRRGRWLAVLSASSLSHGRFLAWHLRRAVRWTNRILARTL